MKEQKSVEYSVVFLLDKKNEDFPSYLKKVIEVFSFRPDTFEVVIIANGTGGFLKRLYKNSSMPDYQIKVYEMNKKTSYAICLKSILKEIRGKYIFVSGAYQQLACKSFTKILDAVGDGTDIISPWRQNRFDPFFYKIQSNLFNALVRWITGSIIHDLSCNVSVFRREVIEETELYANMYRFLPIYAGRKGFTCKEVKCEHNMEHGEPRQAKAGFYYLSVYINRLIDIFTLYFNTSFSKKPLRFFISIGLSCILIGLFITAYIFAQKLTYGFPIGNRSSLLVSIFFMVIGIQSASVGLLGEIIVFTHGRKKKEFVVEKII